jgi:hypothetical protein
VQSPQTARDRLCGQSTAARDRTSSHDCILSEDTLHTINRPVAAGRQRASGLRFADPRVHALLHALILFRQLAQGFRADHLRQHLAAFSGCDPASISQGAVTYQLRRLRLHGLIERVPNSFSYRVTDFGFRVALFFTRTYNRLLRPGLAAVLPSLCPITSPLKRAFDRLTAQIDKMINQAQLATRNLTQLLLDARVLVIDVQGRLTSRVTMSGAERRPHAARHPAIENELDLLGPAEVEVLADHLFEEQAAVHRPVEHLRIEMS